MIFTLTHTIMNKYCKLRLSAHPNTFSAKKVSLWEFFFHIKCKNFREKNVYSWVFLISKIKWLYYINLLQKLLTFKYINSCFSSARIKPVSNYFFYFLFHCSFNGFLTPLTPSGKKNKKSNRLGNKDKDRRVPCACSGSIIRKDKYSLKGEVPGLFLPQLQQLSHWAPGCATDGNCVLLAFWGYLVTPHFNQVWDSAGKHYWLEAEVSFTETRQDVNQSEAPSCCDDFSTASPSVYSLLLRFVLLFTKLTPSCLNCCFYLKCMVKSCLYPVYHM